ncbi:MAG: FlgD immunoglobulin-like domain containing protein, partial [bacterium]
MMDSFQDVFIERQLGVAERLFENSSDWIEGDFYSMDGYLGIGFLAAAASSALGENLFITNPWLHYAPYYLYYNTVPMAYKGIYYYSQHNTSSVLSSEESHPTQLMNMVAAQIFDTDPDLASFAAWYCEDSPYGLEVEDYRYYKPHLFDFFYKFVFGTKHIPKKTPGDAKVALSFKLGQSHVMRSDHSVNDATMIQFYSFKYWYPNGHNEPEQGAINIHRFGPLAVAASNTKNSGDGVPRVQEHGKGMAMNNVFGLGSDNVLDVEMPSVRVENADLPSDFDDGSLAHIGTVEAREYWENEWDYINYNYTRSYSNGDKAKLARRALVYFRGPANSEYIVVMDRVDSEREKYFVLHTPVDIEAVDGNWTSAGGGHWTSNAKTVKVTNTIDQAHGQMYVTSVLPQQATMHKFGGSGYEWVWADGTPLAYSSSDFSEKASYLFGDHTLQIRSQGNYFLTAMKIGDANTMLAPTVESLSGNGWAGVLLDKSRLVIFSDSEAKLQGLSYTVESNLWVKHLVTELDIRREYTVFENGKEYVSGVTASTGRAFFYSFPNGRATYTIQLGGTTSVSQPDGELAPNDFALTNYPNPFSASSAPGKSGTTISFSLSQSNDIELAIYNTTGQLVRRLTSATLRAGEHQIPWDGKGADGLPMASGVYFYRLELNGTLAVKKKLVLMK